MQDDTLELLISIGHYARIYRRFDEARYLFDRLALLYPRRAFPYLGLGLVELDRENYRSASLLFGRAVEAVPESTLALAWLGVCQVFEGHYALGARTLMSVADGDEPGAASMAAAFLKLPECARHSRTARAAQVEPAAAPFSTLERLTIRNGH
jgi:tetratricopeptide (TPR) repeat protein